MEDGKRGMKKDVFCLFGDLQTWQTHRYLTLFHN